MLLPQIRQQGTLIKRYKRFLADIRLQDGATMTVYCPNTGSMKGCSTPGAAVIISYSDNSNRKYPWTLEMIRENQVWIGVNTGMTNRIIKEALENGTIKDFGKIDSIETEVKVSPRSRLDFRLTTAGGSVYIEVKNCSLAVAETAMFPDAVTVRGTKHLEELLTLYESGHQAAIIFCVQRADCIDFRPAAAIDPVYAATFNRVCRSGVQALVYQAEVTPESVTITNKLPLWCDPS